MNPLDYAAITRRYFVGRSPLALGSLALGTILGEARSTTLPENKYAKWKTIPPRAKRVIYLFMSGGPSHVDTFDPKPLLETEQGKPMPKEIIRNHEFAMIKSASPLVQKSPWKFRQHGQSGTEVSELFPHTARVIDDIAVIRSMHTDVPNHEPALLQMHTGNIQPIRPSK